ncbi:Polysaccharide deacetylase [Sphingomonas sp. EC-HK361]|uniref:glycosyltransferase n=1 Tax=Sphingomonas sp. EC-HK361 TaxID=2038397 RepID=UPI0012597346|nr:glycosyltransferase [Sphingomonas sp. EC-HK361]VVT13079.1 Polysaccharide deacetylase [Sphingomonas sp. EC-HK361]
MTKPIFFDPTGARKRWSLRGVLLLIAAIVVASGVFATTIIAVPAGEPLPIRYEARQPLPLKAQVAAIGHRLRGGLRAIGWLPAHPKVKPGAALTVGFYVPWDDASRASLSAHMGQLDWVVPSTMTIEGPNHGLIHTPDVAFERILAGSIRHPAVLPMVQNMANGKWDGAGAAQMLASPAARQKLIADLGAELTRLKAAGAVFDFEDMPRASLPAYASFLRQANLAFNRQHLLVTATVPAGDPDWNLPLFAAATDKLFLMAYDEHWQGGTAGPIASQPWFVAQLRSAIRTIGRDKLIVAFGSYGYDWHGGQVDALTAEEAWLAAHDSGTPITFDPTSGNSHFAYSDDDGAHDVWMLDAASAWNELAATRALGLSGVALWRLGSEDPGVWDDLASWRTGARPDLTRVSPIGNVDVEGNGEILRIAATPTDGARQVTFDARGLIRDQRFTALPTPYIVEKTGARDRQIALTFDDGPDADWTPKILDILKAKQVPATFFIVGENGLAHPLILRRIVDQGSAIGNHSYTHPNMAESSPTSVGLELNATQRLIEAYTGRSTRLFRAPYFGDAEPTTPDELNPALIAQEHGYTVVGLHVDPDDWKRPGVDAIVNRAIAQVLAGQPGADVDNRSGNIILLHDGGGDRSQTVAALPRIIDGLRARGYHFVPVATLAGLTPSQVMPPVSGADLAAVRADVGVFAILAGIVWLLKWLFFVAISLGIARAVLMAALALRNARAERGLVPPPLAPERLVSVIIPAYNEARVIAASVTRVLASTDANIEVIVADDGSKDGTSAIIADAFGDDPRVKLLTLENGGKASALNRALIHAKGDIIVALDADTQFEAGTIAKLVRWFEDETLGAVAGNAKVGNRVNLLTRWQAVEYVTAQNLERRALARFDAVTVVPGAVGAWRRAALDSVGGYPESTLAEDQDLTIAIQRAGWEVRYDIDAVAWTESPETFRALAKQRFRWAFGTLQCLWKHRAILSTRKPAGLAYVGLPQAWVFQIVFAAISPVIDLALALSIIGTAVRIAQHGWAQTQTDVIQMGVYWIAFTAIDVICGWIAYRLEPREKRYPAHLLVAQRFVYRQLMYWVVLKAIGAAVGGKGQGWGTLERSGRVAAPATATP